MRENSITTNVSETDYFIAVQSYASNRKERVKDQIMY
jgi:hypothetical protein